MIKVWSWYTWQPPLVLKSYPKCSIFTLIQYSSQYKCSGCQFKYYIFQVIRVKIINIPNNEVKQVLFIFDSISQLPEPLLQLLKSNHIHVIILSKCFEFPDGLVKEINHKLLRGCKIHDVMALAPTHSTQRLVYTLMKTFNFAPMNADQQRIERLVNFTEGSPTIIEIAAQVLLKYYNLVPHDEIFLNFTGSLDSDSVTKLINSCGLSLQEQLLLNCLSMFGCCPVPLSLVAKMSYQIARISTLHWKLMRYQLMKQYPLPVIFHPHDPNALSQKDPEFVYVPEHLSQYLWDSMDKADKVAVCNVIYHAIRSVCQHSIPFSVESWRMCGICSTLLETLDCNYTLIGKDCYQQVFSLLL